MVSGPKTLGAVAARRIVQAPYSATVHRLFWHIFHITDQTCAINETSEQMAEAIGVSRSSVHRAVRALMEDGHLYRDGSVLHLSPLTAFTGSAAEHQAAIARMPVSMQPSATVHHLKPVS